MEREAWAWMRGPWALDHGARLEKLGAGRVGQGRSVAVRKS